MLSTAIKLLARQMAEGFNVPQPELEGQVKLLLAIVVALTANNVRAATFDGLWKPAPIQLPDGSKVDPYNCLPQEPNGAILIEGNAYGDVEGYCTMANPVAVRGLEATLFDVTCQGDGGSRSDRQLFMLYRNPDDLERLLIVDPHGSSEFERCK